MMSNFKSFLLANNGDFWYGVFPQLTKLGIRHAVSTKLGGTSRLFGDCANMSFNVGDDAAQVLANRRKLAASLGATLEKAVVTGQVHSANIVCVDESFAGRGALQLESALADTDGLITNVPGLPLLLFFADCVPIIIFDPVQKVLAVVHAGWRGTVSRIGALAVQKMQQVYNSHPKDCLAFIGPSIGPCCYEVDDTVAAAVRKEFDFAEQVLQPKADGKFMLNLWQTNKLLLSEAKLVPDKIIISGICTADHNKLFFSHRKERGYTGRLAVMAML